MSARPITSEGGIFSFLNSVRLGRGILLPLQTHSRSIACAAAAALAFCIGGQAAAQSGQEQVTIGGIAEYLDQLTEGRARFEQQNADGTRSTGTIYIDRPWKARIEYDPPEPGLIIATSRRVALIDRKSNEGPKFYPLRATPLYHLLSEDIQITDERFLIGYNVNARFSEVHLRSPMKSIEGYVKLYFQNRPIRILGWTWVDGMGNNTSVTLEGLRITEVDGDLFDINKVVRELGLAE